MTIPAFIPTLLVLVLWGVTAWLSWRREDPESEFNGASDSRKKTGNKKPIWPRRPTSVNGWHADEKKHRRIERWYWLASFVLTCVIAAGAWFSARFAYDAAWQAAQQVETSKEANRMNAESGRAWVSPNGMLFYDSWTADQPFDFKVLLDNTGREPAIHLRRLTNTSMVPVPSLWVPSTWDNPVVDVCEDADLGRSGLVIYPSSQESSHVIHSYIDKSQVLYWVDGKPSTKLHTGSDPAVDFASGKFILMVNGCFTYGAETHRHHSQFCYFLSPDPKKPVRSWEILNCTNGNNAD